MKNILALLAGLDPQKVLIVAAAIGAFYYFMLYDTGEIVIREVADLRTKVQGEEQKKRDTDATLMEEKRMKEAVGILSEKYQLISKKLPSELSTLEINNAIETLA